MLLPDGSVKRRCQNNWGAEKLCDQAQAEKGVTEQEPNSDLPLSVVDSQQCPSSLQVVLTVFTVWADANLRILQDEK